MKETNGTKNTHHSTQFTLTINLLIIKILLLLVFDYGTLIQEGWRNKNVVGASPRESFTYLEHRAWATGVPCMWKCPCSSGQNERTIRKRWNKVIIANNMTIAATHNRRTRIKNYLQWGHVLRAERSEHENDIGYNGLLAWWLLFPSIYDNSIV